jgi:uncharacterized protein involved in exopolysaccharide biosynthesis
LKREIEQAEAVLLEEVLYVLFRRKLLIIALLLIGGGVFGYGVLTDVDSYKAEAIVMIRRLPLGYQMPAESRAVLKRGEVVNSEIEIITSPAVAAEVVDRLGLSEGKNRARVIDNIRRQIKAEAEPESNIIKLSYWHRDRERAADVTNAVLDAYLDVRARVALDSSAVDYLDRQAQRIKGEIDSLGAAIASHGAEDGQLSRGYKSEKHMSLIGRFTSEQTDLDAAIYSMEEKIAMTEEWLASGANVTHAPSSDIYDMATVQQVKRRYLEVKSELASARAKYAPHHPEVKRLERELTSSAEDIRIEVEQALLRERMRLEEWRAERRATVRILADLQAENRKISDETMHMRMLEHELVIRTDLYAGVVDRREQFRITAATDPTLLNVGVVSRATVPVEPSRAGIDMKSVFAFFTFLFGLAFVFAVERMDQSLVRRSDIERELGLKVLAIVRHRSRG